MNWNYEQPVRIIFGNGRIKELNEEVKKLGGTKGILITSKSFVKRGIADEIKNSSNGLIKEVFYEISPNPEVSEVQKCLDIVRNNQIDFVVAIGGGSVLDASKIIACLATVDDPVEIYMEGKGVPCTRLPLICIPTTSGTGSEVTRVSVLSNHEKGIKKPLLSNALYPDLAIIDPELTVSMSAHLTACTGMDALCQAIEGYWSVHHVPVCDALAVHAARLILKYIRRAYNNPEDLEAREKMAEASVIGGMAFSIPRTTSSHACSYPLTSILGIDHGEAVALTIDYFLKINAEKDTDGRILKFVKDVGFESYEDMAKELDQLKQDLNLMRDLKSFNLSDETFEQLVNESMHPNMLNNPTTITKEMVREMYTKLR